MKENPAANIRVYTVWFNAFPGDARSKVNVNLIPDPRVTQWWDEQTLAGRFFAEYEGFNFGPVAYDIYYLYGPNSKWEQRPSPLVSSGYTVLGKSGRLLEDINKLLGP